MEHLDEDDGNQKTTRMAVSSKFVKPSRIDVKLESFSSWVLRLHWRWRRTLPKTIQRRRLRSRVVAL
ncbi:hypothetical protein ACFX13_047240 [Malus domestica]|uniref:Uncharacterized protein n=1 Tax=Malus baccata TaxID=106549 RepID=A0A540N9U9_MALBA|nr:hypothetical protein C1H46_006576 [Malus baccata]